MNEQMKRQTPSVPVNHRPFLIGGIDVGHHTSLALLDLDGTIVYLDTMIHPKISEVLEKMTKMGNVMVLSTDRWRPPTQAKKLAASISAKMMLPARNMTKKKKRILIEDFMEKNLIPKWQMNDHEKAALASALFAYRKFRPGFKKIEDRLKKEGSANRLERMRQELFVRMVNDI